MSLELARLLFAISLLHSRKIQLPNSHDRLGEVIFKWNQLYAYVPLILSSKRKLIKLCIFWLFSTGYYALCGWVFNFFCFFSTSLLSGFIEYSFKLILILFLTKCLLEKLLWKISLSLLDDQAFFSYQWTIPLYLSFWIGDKSFYLEKVIIFD